MAWHPPHTWNCNRPRLLAEGGLLLRENRSFGSWVKVTGRTQLRGGLALKTHACRFLSFLHLPPCLLLAHSLLLSFLLIIRHLLSMRWALISSLFLHLFLSSPIRTSVAVFTLLPTCPMSSSCPSCSVTSIAFQGMTRVTTGSSWSWRGCLGLCLWMRPPPFSRSFEVAFVIIKSCMTWAWSGGLRSLGYVVLSLWVLLCLVLDCIWLGIFLGVHSQSAYAVPFCSESSPSWACSWWVLLLLFSFLF